MMHQHEKGATYGANAEKDEKRKMEKKSSCEGKEREIHNTNRLLDIACMQQTDGESGGI
jgi:hypothetical protein